MRHLVGYPLLLIVLLSAVPCHVFGQVYESGYEPQVIIIQFEPGTWIPEGFTKTGRTTFDQKVHRYHVKSITRMYPFLDFVEPNEKIAENLIALRHTYYLRYDADVIPERVARDFMKEAYVTYAEPVLNNHSDLSVQQSDEPDDPSYDQQSYLQHLQLPQAWGTIKSDATSTPVVIAIIDTGSNWQHEDLQSNVWTNTNEISSNGIDDDNNGFVDDIHGFNFCNDPGPNSDPGFLNFGALDGFHGTAVAGVASAVSDNGIGISGAAWNAQLMHIKAVCPNLNQTFHYEGILYAAINGADIINNSWGATHTAPISAPRYVAQTIDLATDMGSLLVASAGNRPLDFNDYPHYPAAYYRVLSVGATEKDSRKVAAFSSFGKAINVFAPGVNILTTFPRNKYNTSKGTSFSAPLVSGLAALIKTQFPEITPDALRERIRLSSDNIDMYNAPYLSGRLGKGYVNAPASLLPPTLPAVRVQKWSWSDDDGDRQIDSGDQIDIQLHLTNYLVDARNLTVEIILANAYPFLTFMSTQTIIGQLANQDSVEVTFSFKVADDAPLYQAVKFYPRIREGTFVDETKVLNMGINIQLNETVSALQALYESTSGPKWRTRTNWNFEPFPEALELVSWYGVQFRNYRVRGIFLPFNLLNGTIPEELALLKNLQSLSLQGNFLEGQIPEEFGKLASLSDLDVSDNSLSGSIPKELGKISNLISLHLNSNSLVGSLPSELSQLSQLSILNLANNQLSGQIPHELGQLKQLFELRLSHNSFTGQLPRSLMQMRNLTIFEFDGQSLCAPSDEQFQRWLQKIDTVSGATCSGIVFSRDIEDQTYTLNQAITPLILPEATGGSPPITYSLKPSLPSGLTFHEKSRTISGQPDIATSQTNYVYTASDVNLLKDSLSFSIEVASTISIQNDGLPQRFELLGNYPNPFSQTTHLRMNLPWNAELGIEVLDVIGRTLLTLPPISMSAGWSNDIELNGSSLSPGIYLYRVQVLSPIGPSEYTGSFALVR